MLELTGVVKVFNRGTQDEKRALNGIELVVDSGDFVTVIGSNGAGKSTLLNAVAGTLLADEGTIRIKGDDVTAVPDHARARHLARVFQNPSTGTAASMTIEENLCLAELRGKRRGLRWGVTSARRARYREVLAVLGLGLENRLSDRVGLLSGGQRQSLALLMAALNPPEVLLLDEHTAALDPCTADKVMELTDALVRDHRLTTLMVTHNMNQALRFGNRLLMLHEGKVQLDIRGDEKRRLTVAEVIAQFGQTLKDESLLCAT